MRSSTRAALSKLRTAMAPSVPPGTASGAAVVPSAPADLPASALGLDTAGKLGLPSAASFLAAGQPATVAAQPRTAPVDPPGCRPADDRQAFPPEPADSSAAQVSATSSPVQPPHGEPQEPCIAVHGAPAAVRTPSTKHLFGSRLAELFVFGAGGFAAMGLGLVFQAVNVSPAEAHVRLEYPQFTAAERAAMERFPQVLPSDELPSMPATLTTSFTGFRSDVVHYDEAEAQRRTARYFATTTTTTSHQSSNQEQTPTNGAAGATSERLVSESGAGGDDLLCGLDLYCGPGGD